MNRREHRYGNAINASTVTVALTISLTIGFLIGILLGIEYPAYILENYMYNINNFAGMSDSRDFMLQSFFGYAGFVVIMWVLGLTKFIAANLLIVCFRGTSLGFVTGSLLSLYGLQGLLHSLFLFVPQNIVLVFIYFFINLSGAKFIKRQFALEYILVLVICLCGIFLISLYESLILPRMIRLVF